MPMTKTGMSSAIKSAISGKFDIVNDSELGDFADALADALVTYIQANATVSVAGVQSGSSAATGTVS